MEDKVFSTLNGYVVKDSKARTDIETLNTNLGTTNTNLSNLGDDVLNNSSDISNIKNDINTIDGEITNIKGNVSTLSTNVSNNTRDIERANQSIDDVITKINPIDMYKGKNLVVFGDSWTDPDNLNARNGAWVNRVCQATGMRAYNYAKGAASYMRSNNSYRMQMNRALQMSEEEKKNTSIVIFFACDTDIIEDINETDYKNEVDDLIDIAHTNYPNAKIIWAGFTWRINKLTNYYYSKMKRLIHHVSRNSSKYPCVVLQNASLWLLGKNEYFQNEYHPNDAGYFVVAHYMLQAIYGSTEDDVRDYYDVSLNLDDQTDDRYCGIDVVNGYASIRFYCVFSETLTDKLDWIAGIPKLIVSTQGDINIPLMTSNGDFVGTMQITSGYNGRINLKIKSLPAGTPVFASTNYFRCEANFEF